MDELTTMVEMARPFIVACRYAERFESVEARREAYINAGRALLQIRKTLTATQDFGRFLQEKDLNWGTPQNRSNAIWLAEHMNADLVTLLSRCPYANPDQVRNWLRKQENPEKEPRKTTTAGESVVTRKVREHVRQKVRDKEPISIKEVVKETGHSRIVVEAAIAFERGAAEALQEAGVNRDDLSLTAQQKLDRAIAQSVARIRAEYDAAISQEVHKHFNEYLLPLYKKQLEDADAIAANYKPPFTNSEFRKIWAALHPDVCSVSWAAEVYALFGQRAFRLRGSDPESKPLAENFPTSLDELIRRREEVRQRNSDRSKKARKATNV